MTEILFMLVFLRNILKLRKLLKTTIEINLLKDILKMRLKYVCEYKILMPFFFLFIKYACYIFM